MTCARPGSFPPSSHLPIFRHTKDLFVFHFSLFHCVSLSSYPSVNHFTLSPPLFSFHISFFLPFHSAYPIFFFFFKSAQHFKFPQITVYRRAPLSSCNSNCIFCQTTLKPQNHWPSSSLMRPPLPPPGVAGGVHKPPF